MTTSTAVDRVTVYRNGALVVRTGTGAGTVELGGLPLLFSSDSLRVRPARGAVRDLEETVRLFATPAPPPVDEAARVELALAIAQLDDQVRALEAVLHATEALSPEAPDPRRVEHLVDAASYVALVRFTAARVDELHAELRRLHLERKQLAEKMRALDERAVPDTAPPVVTRGCRFTLEGESAFEVEYFVAAARWVPTYALELTTSGASAAAARLTCGALVAQASGEDWSGVKLAVSTADLLRETNQPPLSSWRIGRAQAARTKAWRPLPSDLPTLFRGFDHGPRVAVPPTGATTPTSSSVEPSPALPHTIVAKPAPKAGSATGEFDKLSTDELRSFEKTRSGAGMAKAYDRKDLGRDDDEGGAMLSDLADEPELDAYANAVPDAAFPADERTAADVIMPLQAQAMPARASAPMPAGAPLEMPRAKSAGLVGGLFGGMGGGGPGSGKKQDAGHVRVHEELPARWRTAYMRMAAANESARGHLVPLDPIARLHWLLDAHDVDGAGRAELHRAVHALNAAQQRLQHTPLPKGTSALLGTHFFAVLEANERTDVPGDGTFYRVEVRRDEGPATLEHRCVPRESNDVWRFCRLDVKGAPMPAGPLAVYEDGAFKVNAKLDGAAGGKPLDINLGVDPDVRVVGRTAHTHQHDKGLMSSTTRVEHQVKLELRSTRKQPATVVVYDRLPHVADNVRDVHVTMLDEKPPAKRTDKDPAGNEVKGGLEWRVVVMPGDLSVIAHSYAIDLPAKTELEGGNRRE